jgi:class 3 adenylate cyclase
MENKWQRIASSPEAAALLKLFLRIDNICDHEGEITDFLPNLLHQLAQLLDVQLVAVTALASDDTQMVLGRYDRGSALLANEEIIDLADMVLESGGRLTEKPEIKGVKNILAIPIDKRNELLGCLILVNKTTGTFGEYDNIVVTLVEVRLDDLIDEMLTRERQRRISTENRVMKELDSIRDESHDHGKALDQMIATILESVSAEIGFITLYDSEKDRHMPGGKVISGPRPMSQHDYHRVGNLIRDAKNTRQTIFTGKISGSEIDSIIAVPMFMSGLFLGAVVLINKKDGTHFTEQDKDLVESVARMIDSFIFQEEKFKRLMVLVGQEATRDVEEALIGHRPDTAQGQRMLITMLFADIRDYSHKILDMDPSTAVRMLNDYYNAITPIISAHGGVVDKFVGDEVVALFTQDQAKGKHQFMAVETAMAMQAELERLNREWELTGRPTIQIGIGIHTGEVVLGQIGSFDRKDYTAIGSNMNFAARLQSVAKPGEVIISEATYLAITGIIMARRVGPFKIKGFGDIMPYLVEGRSPEQF